MGGGGGDDSRREVPRPGFGGTRVSNCSVARLPVVLRSGDDPGDFYKRNTDSALAFGKIVRRGSRAPICFCFLFVGLREGSIGRDLDALRGQPVSTANERDRDLGMY